MGVHESAENGPTEHRRGELGGSQARQERNAPIVDCDVHPALANGLRDLLPYLEKPLRRRLEFMLTSPFGQSRYAVPGNTLYMNPGGLLRRDSAPGGIVPGSEPDVMADQLLDAYNVSRAVLLLVDVLGLGIMPDPHVASAIASASNDWLLEQWLERDARYRGSIAITPQDPARAAREIERMAVHQSFVQVFMPLTNALIGNSRFYPIYEVAEAFDLPIALHPGPEMVYYAGAMPAGGPPTYYLEWHTLLGQAYAANLVSFLVQRVTVDFPRLKLIIMEAGCGWVPDILWRLDRDWMSVRDEVPWLTKFPSAKLFECVRFTTQPFVEPEEPDHLRALCDIIHGDQTLVFSSDYPHWDFDNPQRVLNHLAASTQRRILYDNAMEFYGSRLALPPDLVR